MSGNSSIEWTDATWNPVRGCVKVSAGCKHCYAETFAERWRGVKGHAYEQGFDLRLVPEKLAEPFKWKTGKRIFVNSMSDLFQVGVPDDFIDRVFAVMALAGRHTFQVLTKRADRMREYFRDPVRRRAAILAHALTMAGDLDGRPEGGLLQDAFLLEEVWAKGNYWPLPNVWLGVSVENQACADNRISLLLDTPAAIRFISAEPLLEAVDLYAFLDTSERNKCLDILGSHKGVPGLDLVIVGAESGAGARLFEIAWARALVQQCKAAGCPVFVKQLGATPRDRNDAGFEGDTPTSWPMDSDVHDADAGGYQGAPVFVRLTKKGGTPDEWPEDLRVRHLPNGAVPRG